VAAAVVVPVMTSVTVIALGYLWYKRKLISKQLKQKQMALDELSNANWG
jgi:hypothetical protein